MPPETPLLQNKDYASATVFTPASLLRETRRQKSLPNIEAARAEGVLAVEMEAASFYAFAQAKQKPVVCFAHITNRMGVSDGDFEKGEADGSLASLRLIKALAQNWRNRPA